MLKYALLVVPQARTALAALTARRNAPGSRLAHRVAARFRCSLRP
jgi:hypothetical protein